MVTSPSGVRILYLDLIELTRAAIRHILLLKLYLRKILLLLETALGLLITKGEWVSAAVSEGLLAVVWGYLRVLV